MEVLESASAEMINCLPSHYPESCAIRHRPYARRRRGRVFARMGYFKGCHRIAYVGRMNRTEQHHARTIVSKRRSQQERCNDVGIATVGTNRPLPSQARRIVGAHVLHEANERSNDHPESDECCSGSRHSDGEEKNVVPELSYWNAPGRTERPRGRSTSPAMPHERIKPAAQASSRYDDTSSDRTLPGSGSCKRSRST